MVDAVTESGLGHFNVILLFGMAILTGTVGAYVFQRLRVPQVIGYIVVGVVLGPLLKLFSQDKIETLEPFSFFALGIIGFLIGGELKKDVFVRFGRQVAAILVFEGISAFCLVILLSFPALCYFYEWHIALAAALVFGAICSATDPASSVNVLWEYKARGPLTTMLTAIVALDDALAMVLYIAGVGIGSFLTGGGGVGFPMLLLRLFWEIGGSAALGAAAAAIMGRAIKWTQKADMTLVVTIGLVAFTVGSARAAGLDVILSTMAMGVVLANVWPRRALRCFEAVRHFSLPVYVVFFVMVGARFKISFAGPVLLLAALYVIGSIVGKTVGSYWGAVYSGAAPTVRRYLGFCLYQQGTIALALLIMASHRFEGQLRDMMLSVIILGVFVLQLFGPVFVKAAIRKAGEAGMNITESDLEETYRVSNVMDTQVPAIGAGTSLRDVIAVVSGTDKFCYPVVGADGKLAAVVTLDGIRNIFATQELSDWLVALDIAEPAIGKVTPELSLAEALRKARILDVDHLPVVDSEATDNYVGVLDCRAVRRQLSAEVLARQQKADSVK